MLSSRAPSRISSVRIVDQFELVRVSSAVASDQGAVKPVSSSTSWDATNCHREPPPLDQETVPTARLCSRMQSPPMTASPASAHNPLPRQNPPEIIDFGRLCNLLRQLSNPSREFRKLLEIVEAEAVWALRTRPPR